MAANSPTESLDPDRRDALADVALYAFHWAVAADPWAEKGVLLSEVVLRAGMIHRLGPKAGTVRDPAELWRLVDGAIAPAEPLRQMISSGRVNPFTVPIDEIRRLRHVKNVLRGAEAVLEDEGIERPDNIDWWWQRREVLP